LKIVKKIQRFGKFLTRKSVSNIRSNIHRLKYGESHPREFKIIWVKPSKIQKSYAGNVENFNLYSKTYGTYIRDGNWDHKTDDFKNNEIYQALRRRFIQGESWFNLKPVENATSGKDTLWHDYNNTEELYNRLDKLDLLYENMRKSGYKTQRELNSPSVGIYSKITTMFVPPEYYEIQVLIGRDGEIIHFSEGQHRLSIAKILDVAEVPVRVLVRHKKWQQLRNDIISNMDTEIGVPERLLDHPDIRTEI